jgi:hypothetical protein
VFAALDDLLTYRVKCHRAYKVCRHITETAIRNPTAHTDVQVEPNRVSDISSLQKALLELQE